MLTIPQQVAAVMRRKVQIIRGNMLATGLNLLYVRFAYPSGFSMADFFEAPTSSKPSSWVPSS